MKPLVCSGDRTDFISKALPATVKNYLKIFHITMHKNEIVTKNDLFLSKSFSNLCLLVDRSLIYLRINRSAVNFSFPLRHLNIHNSGSLMSGNGDCRLVSLSTLSLEHLSSPAALSAELSGASESEPAYFLLR